jgi:hypothetical protein
MFFQNVDTHLAHYTGVITSPLATTVENIRSSECLNVVYIMLV